MIKKKFLFSLLFLWFIVVSCSLLFNLKIAENGVEQTVLNIGRSFFKEIETTRLWNAIHGGVYVPITEKTKPNPYLQDPNRDVVTTTGLYLTKINPAFMTRQIAEIAKYNSSIQYHITSLKPIRPANKADRWETKALHDFENDAKEFFEFFQEDLVYKYIAPLPVKKACLKCHTKQGYKLGDIRGGISVTIPAETYLAANQTAKNTLWLIHALVLFLGGGIVYLFIFFQNKYTQEQIQLNEKMQKEKTNILDTLNLELEDRVRERTYELQSIREKLFVTLQSIGDGVITTDIEGRITFINKIVENLTGWSQDEAVGLPLLKVFHIIYEKTGLPCDNPVDKVLASGQIIGLADHTHLIAKDGRRINIEDSGAPIYNKDSKIIGVVLVFRDVTEKKKIQRELLKVKKLESVGVLAGGIAHDFNNILTAILGNINLAGMYIDPEDTAYPLLKEAEKASIRAKDLTQQLLTFSKGGDPVKQTASIDKIITDSTDFILHGSSVSCLYHIPEDLWMVNVDPGHMSQVIQNIVLNACQAMPEGGVLNIVCANIPDVKTELIRLPPGKYIQITIHDNGVGIPEKYLDKIFDPYFTTKQTGSGLGLAITHSIISKHDGNISVQSEVGKGTTFTIYLPAMQQIGRQSEKAEQKKGQVAV